MTTRAKHLLVLLGLLCMATYSSAWKFGDVAVFGEATFTGHVSMYGSTVEGLDNGGPTHASVTLSPASDVVHMKCSDANGCDVTLSESHVHDGWTVYIHCETNHSDFTDTAGVTELSGNFICNAKDTLILMYDTEASAWVEFSRSNN